jgi:hypothetical protein
MSRLEPDMSGFSLWNPDKEERPDMSDLSLWNLARGPDMSGLIGVSGGRVDF